MATPKKKKPVKAAKKAPAKASKVAKKKTAKPKAPVKKVAAARPTTLTRDAGVEGNAENTALDTLYIVNASDNKITLEINVGAEEQTGDMTIKLDNDIIVENHAGDFPETTIGTNKSLNGKKLSIIATIADTSRKTNFTGLGIHLKGGITPNDFNLAKTVDEEGASVDYLCLIEFFKP